MISIVIPTYKNKKIFLKNLKHNLVFLKNCEIIIINDDPTTDLKNYLIKNNYQKNSNIIILQNKKNLGFGPSVNKGVKKAKNKFIMLLNDDVILNDDSYKKAISYFQKDKNLFAVSFAQKEKDGSIVGKNKYFWKQGLFFHQKDKNIILAETGWAEGGACLIDKEKFNQLNGFDPRYSPFYWEDIDLSYRAKKAGYKIIFDPKILVNHHHESTIGKYFSKDFVKTIAFRNQFLFIWKNASLKEKIIHFLLLPFNLFYYSFFKRELNFVKGMIMATIKLYKKG